MLCLGDGIEVGGVVQHLSRAYCGHELNIFGAQQSPHLGDEKAEPQPCLLYTSDAADDL